MTAAARRDRALLLAAVAAIGFVVLPLLHAEEHRREEREDDAAAEQIAEAWKAGSGDSLDALAWALEHVHDSGQPGEHHEQGAPARRHHSHGQDSNGQDSSGGSHGSGALAHLGLALHGSPALPQLESGVQVHAPPSPIAAQLLASLRYLVPEWSQGPPPGC